MSIQIIKRSTLMTHEREFRQLFSHPYSKYNPADEDLINNPQKYILDKGGNIFFALQNTQVVGCAIFLVHDIFICELKKIVVIPTVKDVEIIKHTLCNEIITTANSRGFRKIIFATTASEYISLLTKYDFSQIDSSKVSKYIIDQNDSVYYEKILADENQMEYYL